MTAAGEMYVGRVPLKVDAAFMDLGHKKYDIFCATCHGLLGDGNSLVGRHMSFSHPRRYKGPSIANGATVTSTRSSQGSV